VMQDAIDAQLDAYRRDGAQAGSRSVFAIRDA
jgi:hypothetical protein